MEINKLFATNHAQNQPVLVTTAKDRIGRNKVPADLAKMIKKLPPSKTANLPGELPMYVGMPIFLTKNIAVELGLTNGTTGIIRSIHLQNGENIHDAGFHDIRFKDADCIVAELDDITVKPLQGLDENHIPIFPRKETFSLEIKGKKDNGKKSKKSKKKGISLKRDHFPIVPRFACTAHKSQGMTLPKATVDLVPQPDRRGGIDVSFAYVPLSRVRRLEDLAILRNFDPSVMKVTPKPACMAMLEHFKAMDKCKDI
jgi:ATP-dependent exoDNAse (exonuclease V) alpha subunit